ncbi:MAG TPA: dihydrodipicolinate reductase C-terminal domain-containing protein [Candidatus Sulfotelmatobacter sp.]|nr:dihydrodipicolinate reductase C-terminal domain-containing protein [Candidatus Sulfotelmatobacter sp.]
MKIALVGYGRMGHAIEAAARTRGHEVALVVDKAARGARGARSLGSARLSGVDVAFEFTEGEAALENVLALLARGVPVVSGTTGWNPDDPLLAAALRRHRGAFLHAPNFSVGVAAFFRAAGLAAAVLRSAGGYDAWIVESHHAGKRDAPSGTAKRLATIGGGNVPVASVRAGHDPGRHTIGFDGPHDVLTLTHQARSREAFASGAVAAGEWLRGRRGRFGFDDVVDDLLRGRGAGKARGGKR